MRAGAIDRRITIQRYSVVGDDGMGNQITEWADLATVWAKVRQEGGREFFAQAAIQAERRVIFTIRWMEVWVIDRIQYDGIEYNIKEVRELGRQAGVELHAVG
ncbi:MULTISPECIES: phage head closure protein [unclassified Shinella]|uniref:phage head closure protein n=1 Tax=unclassified Shinella TaxID=2643062 RepID=UPI00225D6252|nr:MULTISPECIES: phage head closure protein [unclassified Shinella]MCO5139290.1 phage head closure protein [Shinella sp.]MDC7255981.1 phage head closure protein [Shinella sp. YE25]CAI0338817.1 Phage head-tail adaptor [Rhizobiaceae bacterium]CAK7257248.1 Phage head-tail adaptor [Shinella sp. WSC3-e]